MVESLLSFCEYYIVSYTFSHLSIPEYWLNNRFWPGVPLCKALIQGEPLKLTDYEIWRPETTDVTLLYGGSKNNSDILNCLGVAHYCSVTDG